MSPAPGPLPRHIPSPAVLSSSHGSFSMASSLHAHRPVRISVATFNIWGDELMPARGPRLVSTVQRMRPDVLLLQEVTEGNLSLIEDALPSHASLRQVGAECFSMEGEGCILWDKETFHLLDSGAEDLSETVNPSRKLLWARLQVAGSASVLLVCTAHLPWTGSEVEVTTGVNPRIAISRRIAECLAMRHSLHPDDVVVLGGDMNDDFHPARVLRCEAGLADVFEQMDLPPPVTHPVRPSSDREEMRVGTYYIIVLEPFIILLVFSCISVCVICYLHVQPNRTLDWIFTHPPPPTTTPLPALGHSHLAPEHHQLVEGDITSEHDVLARRHYRTARVVAALAIGVRGGGFPPPSDHLPVLAVLELPPA